MIGYEAGQSAFGDVYAWFKTLLSWPLEAILPTLAGISDEVKRQIADGIASGSSRRWSRPPRRSSLEETVPLALDWMNGRRTPDANQRLTGAITGIRLGTDAPRIYRSLVEATAFGSRAIVERFRAQGIRIDSAIAIGGVAKKSRFVMQTIADVMNMDVTVAAGDQTVALGAAMFAATAAGLHRQCRGGAARDVGGHRRGLPARSGAREALRPSLQGLPGARLVRGARADASRAAKRSTSRT